ncbi:hypothetical protein JW935_05925, partial [candidate division KSB1 bacterium]|nr:hypothetical protein [candidate division KSB1 bacterium]
KKTVKKTDENPDNQNQENNNIVVLSEDVSEPESLLGSLFNIENVIRIVVKREKPLEAPYGGYIGSFSPPFDESQLAETYGGGTYKAVAYAEGSKFIRGVRFTIAGEPKSPKSNDNNHSQAIDEANKILYSNFQDQQKGFINLLTTVTETAQERDRTYYQQLLTMVNEQAKQTLELFKQKSDFEKSQILDSLKNQNGKSDTMNDVMDFVSDIIERISESQPDFIDVVFEKLDKYATKFAPMLEGLIKDENTKNLIKRLTDVSTEGEANENPKPNRRGKK